MRTTMRPGMFVMLTLVVMAFGYCASVSVAQVPDVNPVAVGCGFCGHPVRYPWHYPGCRYYGLGLNNAASRGSGGGGGGQTTNPQVQMVQALAPLLQQAISGLFRTDPAQEAQRQQAIREAAERARQEQERLRAEEAARRQGIYDRLSKQLVLSGLGELAPMGFDGNSVDLTPMGFEGTGGDLAPMGFASGEQETGDENLHPKGTGFFGQGGDAGSQTWELEPSNDPKVVDLRNCRRAAFLAEAGENAAPEDAERLLDEAVKGAQGDRSFVADPPSGAVAVVSEAGLKAFQESNIAYAKAHDLNMRQAELFNQAQARRELAAAAVRIKKEQLEKEMAEKLDSAALEEKHKMMADLYAAAKAEYEAWVNAKAEADAARSREAFDRAMLITSARTISVPSPEVPAQIIRREREALEPDIPARIWHVMNKALAMSASEALDQFVQASFNPVNDPAAQEKLSRLVERIQALSLYPDEHLRVQFYGLPNDPSDPDCQKLMGLSAFSTSNAIYFNYSDWSSMLAGGKPTDEAMFIAGHELAHIQRDHFALFVAATKGAEIHDWAGALMGTEQSKWRPEIKLAVREVVMHDLNYEQELEAERLGTALALGAGAPLSAQRTRYTHWISRTTARPATEELTADHPTPQQYFDALKKIYGDPLAGRVLATP